MIALCANHHGQAKGYTAAFLRDLKTRAAQDVERIAHEFQWLRNDLLLYVGGNLYYRTPVVFRYKGTDVISLTRNEEGYLILNISMLTASDQPRLKIVENFWEVFPTADIFDISAPPGGNKLTVKYLNGDFLEVEFRECADVEAVEKLTGINPAWLALAYPITVVSAANTVAGTSIAFTANETTLGVVRMTNSIFNDCAAGIIVN